MVDARGDKSVFPHKLGVRKAGSRWIACNIMEHVNNIASDGYFVIPPYKRIPVSFGMNHTCIPLRRLR